MSLNAFPPMASYDDDGNIIIPSRLRAEPEPEPEPQFEMPRKEAGEPVQAFVSREEDITEWIIVEDQPADLHRIETPEFTVTEEDDNRVPFTAQIASHITAVRSITRGAVREGAKQYKVTVSSGIPLLGQMQDDLRAFFRTIWNFLAQPVWVPTRKREVKQYSRGTLFLLDIVRFGGTFTVIFLGLFVALNYDSFWQITSSKVSTILESPSISAPQSGEDGAIIETLKANAAASADARERGELLSFLPNVGPPDNRILIPKLKLNVPLVTPPMESLLRQDWVKVEEDIQTALAEGVVHYPGTAKPGQAGNFFVTGHSSYYPWAPGKYKTIFARLQELQKGDEYWVYFKGDRHRYVVTGKKEVSPSDVTVLDQPVDRRISTLMTCTPVGTTLRRLVVIAQEVDPLTGVPLKVGERAEKDPSPKLQLEALPI